VLQECARETQGFFDINMFDLLPLDIRQKILIEVWDYESPIAAVCKGWRDVLIGSKPFLVQKVLQPQYIEGNERLFSDLWASFLVSNLHSKRLDYIVGSFMLEVYFKLMGKKRGVTMEQRCHIAYVKDKGFIIVPEESDFVCHVEDILLEYYKPQEEAQIGSQYDSSYHLYNLASTFDFLGYIIDCDYAPRGFLEPSHDETTVDLVEEIWKWWIENVGHTCSVVNDIQSMCLQNPSFFQMLISIVKSHNFVGRFNLNLLQ